MAANSMWAAGACVFGMCWPALGAGGVDLSAGVKAYEKGDYIAAYKVFKPAAERGQADAQYNLGVLAARGLGTDKNFAESYKWFALAAARGDAESAKKRDEVASHLDPQAFAAAQQAVKSSVPAPQPEEATAVPKPQGGWDDAKGAGAEAAPTPVKPKTNTRPAPHSPLSLGSFTVGKQ